MPIRGSALLVAIGIAVSFRAGSSAYHGIRRGFGAIKAHFSKRPDAPATSDQPLAPTEPK